MPWWLWLIVGWLAFTLLCIVVAFLYACWVIRCEDKIAKES